MKHTLSCWLPLLFSLYIFFSLMTVTAQEKGRQGVAREKVPAIFAFGDSVVDPGNNNDLLSLVKANFPPYGKDFDDGKATGRFSNGRLVTDLLVTAQEKGKQGVAREKVPAIFAFGDSVVDPGNNNDLLSLVKANFPPYGKDFDDGKATGRFSNGRLSTDFLAEELGIKKNIPAYLDSNLSEEELLTGVSFASSGAGYDPMTSKLILVKSPEQQLKMFKEYIGKVNEIAGVEKTNYILNNSIFFVVAGTDDLANTYFSTPFRRFDYDVDVYTDLMLKHSASFLKKLHKLGARKIAVANTPPIGYTPLQRTLGGGPLRECPDDYNEAAQSFNSKLKDQLQFLSTKLQNSKIVYMDLYSMLLDLVLNKTHYGFEVVDRGCCGSGLIEGAVLCNSFSDVCEDRSKYLFWDCYHPIEKACQIMSKKIAEKYLPLFS